MESPMTGSVGHSQGEHQSKNQEKVSTRSTLPLTSFVILAKDDKPMKKRALYGEGNCWPHTRTDVEKPEWSESNEFLEESPSKKRTFRYKELCWVSYGDSTFLPLTRPDPRPHPRVIPSFKHKIHFSYRRNIIVINFNNVKEKDLSEREKAGLNTAEEEEKEEKHIHVWREKVGQFNQRQERAIARMNYGSCRCPMHPVRQGTKRAYFLLFSSILLYEYNTIYLSISLLIDFGTVFCFDDDDLQSCNEKGFEKMEKTLLLLNGTPLQYSCLVHPMDGGAWKNFKATVFPPSGKRKINGSSPAVTRSPTVYANLMEERKLRMEEYERKVWSSREQTQAVTNKGTQAEKPFRIKSSFAKPLTAD
ncbi:hypothetical protein MG293_001714 [Ovis ammon polii]|uniref:Uncharacterized protein n=1 Tax=Ovis ammon polii TaxID=230172 RepID=A0AAD4YIA9_OVIAM|nr:hypothetical protein MG293_001714 [Ovis ammon polii]